MSTEYDAAISLGLRAKCIEGKVTRWWRPGAGYRCLPDGTCELHSMVYGISVWTPKPSPPDDLTPTLADIQAEQARLQAIEDAGAYLVARRKDIEATPTHEREEAMREQLAALVVALGATPTTSFAALEAVVAKAKTDHKKSI